MHYLTGVQQAVTEHLFHILLNEEWVQGCWGTFPAESKDEQIRSCCRGGKGKVWATSSDAYSEIVREGRCWGLLKFPELLYKLLKQKRKNPQPKKSLKNTTKKNPPQKNPSKLLAIWHFTAKGKKREVLTWFLTTGKCLAVDGCFQMTNNL